jgi:hypothetical protein
MTGATPATGPAPAGRGPDPEPSPTDAAAAGGGGTTAGAATGPQLTTGPAPAMSARDARRAARRERRDNNGPLIFGGILVIVGILAFAGQVIPGLDWDLIWPIGLIVLGAALVIGATRRRPSA